MVDWSVYISTISDVYYIVTMLKWNGTYVCNMSPTPVLDFGYEYHHLDELDELNSCQRWRLPLHSNCNYPWQRTKQIIASQVLTHAPSHVESYNQKHKANGSQSSSDGQDLWTAIDIRLTKARRRCCRVTHCEQTDHLSEYCTKNQNDFWGSTRVTYCSRRNSNALWIKPISVETALAFQKPGGSSLSCFLDSMRRCATESAM